MEMPRWAPASAPDEVEPLARTHPRAFIHASPPTVAVHRHCDAASRRGQLALDTHNPLCTHTLAHTQFRPHRIPIPLTCGPRLSVWGGENHPTGPACKGERVRERGVVEWAMALPFRPNSRADLGRPSWPMFPYSLVNQAALSLFFHT